ncbi:MAG: restriction endonuclease subunit S [Methanoregula sp.]|nr:restriction endonuclease subunit S [Methanoregula sp.]
MNESTDIPEGYTVTELGVLPEDWSVIQLGKIAKGFSGLWGSDPSGNQNSNLIDVQVIRVSDILENFMIRYYAVPLRSLTKKQIEKYQLIFGDIVVVKSSGSKTKVKSGRCAFFDYKDITKIYIPSNFTFALRIEQKIANSYFIWFYLISESTQKTVQGMTDGSTYPNLKKTEYLTLLIPLPPPPSSRTARHRHHPPHRAGGKGKNRCSDRSDEGAQGGDDEAPVHVWPGAAGRGESGCTEGDGNRTGAGGMGDFNFRKNRIRWKWLHTEA